MKEFSEIRILTADDHPLVCEGIAALVKDQPDMTIIAEAHSGRETLEKFRQFKPDITLLDLSLGDANGVDVLRDIRLEFPDARVIMLTMFDGDVEIKRALKTGASAFLLKGMSSQNLIKTIRLVSQGEKFIPPEVAAKLAEHFDSEFLTARETQILKLVSSGKRNQDIGEQLFISEGTVKVHVRNILEKLGASDRTQAVAIALRRGIIQI